MPLVKVSTRIQPLRSRTFESRIYYRGGKSAEVLKPFMLSMSIAARTQQTQELQ